MEAQFQPFIFTWITANLSKVAIIFLIEKSNRCFNNVFDFDYSQSTIVSIIF